MITENSEELVVYFIANDHSNNKVIIKDNKKLIKLIFLLMKDKVVVF